MEKQHRNNAQGIFKDLKLNDDHLEIQQLELPLQDFSYVSYNNF